MWEQPWEWPVCPGFWLYPGWVAGAGMHGSVVKTLLQLLQQLRGHGNSCRRAGGMQGRREQMDQEWTCLTKEVPIGEQLLAVPPV